MSITFRTASLVLAAAAALAGCGGSPSEDLPPPPVAENREVPASAVVSSSAWTQYALSLAPSETDDPLGLKNVAAAPASETEEPVSVPR